MKKAKKHHPPFGTTFGEHLKGKLYGKSQKDGTRTACKIVLHQAHLDVLRSDRAGQELIVSTNDQDFHFAGIPIEVDNVCLWSHIKFDDGTEEVL